MANRNNQIILAVVAVLAVAAVFLFVSAGGLTPAGGGGASTVQADAMESVGNTSVQNVSYDELMGILEDYGAPTGSNERSAAEGSRSANVSETAADLSNRGFDPNSLTVFTTMDGELFEGEILDTGSTEVYPAYVAYYQSGNGILWALYSIDGGWTAAPLATQTGPLAKEVVLAESDTITQYDAYKNAYSDFTVGETQDTTSVKVPAIDRATLDSYDASSLEVI